MKKYLKQFLQIQGRNLLESLLSKAKKPLARQAASIFEPYTKLLFNSGCGI